MKGNHKHGHSPANGATPTYQSWAHIIQRCNNPKVKNFSNYGGRGITVCERWMTFANFLKDMGEMPPGREIERIDNNGNYEPGNCRWATHLEQSNNRRTNHNVNFHGRTMTISAVAREVGMPTWKLNWRINSGYSVEQAVAIPFVTHRGYVFT